MPKTALITGSSSGIGYELARIHAENGDNLVLVALNKSNLDQLKTELENKYKNSVYTIEKDLSVPGSANEVYDEVKENNIEVDYLINNAGFGDFGLFENCDWTKQEQMINLNILAVAQMTRLFLPEMINRRSGKILNTASTASFQPGPTMSVYFASKAFVLSFSEAINNEVSDRGITVTALCPGSTQTGFHQVTIGEGKPVKERKIPSARDVAEYGYKSMMKGRAVAIHGLKNAIMANLVRLGPRSVVVKMARKIQSGKYNTT